MTLLDPGPAVIDDLIGGAPGFLADVAPLEPSKLDAEDGCDVWSVVRAV
jgi:hypothetical protein